MLARHSFLAILLVQQFMLHSGIDRVAVKAESNESGYPLREKECATWHYRDHNGQCQCYVYITYRMSG
jgi:hypothetical protein